MLMKVIFILILPCTHSFYLPGIAPAHFCPEDVEGCKSEIEVFVNRLNTADSVIPFDYDHFDFCTDPPDKPSPSENLGQVIFGERIKPSLYKITFKEESKYHKACDTKNYTKSKEGGDIKKLNFLRMAIKLNYQHHWIIDNMPVTFCYFVNGQTNKTFCLPAFPIGCYVDNNLRGKNGCEKLIHKPESGAHYLFNHIDFLIDYHPKENDWGKDLPPTAARLVKVRVSLKSINYGPTFDIKNKDKPLIIPPNLESPLHITYTYSVSFNENKGIKWSSRWDFILESYGDSKIQWFSIVNSLLIVLMLSGMVAMIFLRNLSRDIARYNKSDIEIDEEEFGWKLVHGDVFRSPRRGMLLSVFVGSGVQIFFMVLITLFFACLGFLSPANRGSLMTCVLVLYVCLGTPSGYVSSRIYKMFDGVNWKTNVILTALLCPGIVFAIFFILNIVFWFLQSSATVPFSTLIAILALWFGISVPLTFVGAYFGFRSPAVEYPVRVNQIPRQILPGSWYTSFIPSCIMAGILPFGCISIQLFFILSSIWGQQVYYMFGCLFIVIIILIVTCSETAILLCYFQLCGENYQWWWRSFLGGASSSLYFFGYCTHYFVTKMESTGFASGLLYFGYTFIMAFLVFLFTGTIGFLACFWFVKKIYSVIKVD